MVVHTEATLPIREKAKAGWGVSSHTLCPNGLFMVLTADRIGIMGHPVCVCRIFYGRRVMPCWRMVVFGTFSKLSLYKAIWIEVNKVKFFCFYLLTYFFNKGSGKCKIDSCRAMN